MIFGGKWNVSELNSAQSSRVIPFQPHTKQQGVQTQLHAKQQSNPLQPCAKQQGVQTQLRAKQQSNSLQPCAKQQGVQTITAYMSPQTKSYQPE